MVRAIVLALCMALLLTGCAKPAAEPPAPLEEPISLASFTFMARGMTMESIYSYTAEKAENGTRLYLELNCGRDIIDVTAEEDVLGELGAIAAMYRLDTWNGFDKVNKWVSDGEGFTLRMTTADGQDIYANGSNEFPVNYYEAREAIDLFFQKYVE
ncbi:MAG: hypothetical protein IKU32_00960 [Clostridia bacterium]|nr:hypothetical protein [Clostridia bacterium]